VIAELFRSRASLEAKILAQRQQVNVLQRPRPKRPRLSSIDYSSAASYLGFRGTADTVALVAGSSRPKC